MNAELTLTMEHSVIERAERYAKARKRSLSDLVENYFKVVTTSIPSNDAGLAPIAKLLKGSFHAPADFDYKQELENSLTEKYL
ncbi:hypothetical protein FACS1894199_03450 [Bacteroidia bacterium]|nr:hypothetical protein FACS1894199_03450 [Bacteroidia bacterium]